MKPAVERAKIHVKARQKSLQTAMKQLGFDAFMLTHPADLAYLSDFTGEDSVGLFTGKDFWLITDFRYQEQARLEAGWMKQSIREGKMAEQIARVLKETGVKRIGFEANYATVGQVDAIQKSIRGLGINPAPELVPVEDVMLNIRKVKDDHEIEQIRKAVAIAEEAYTAVRGEIKVGLSENHIAGMLIFEMRSRGGEVESFPPIIASGAAAAQPHYRPGETLIRKDQPLLIDWGCRFNSYCSDLTRTLIMGRIPAKLKEAYKVTLEAQLAAISFLRPGVTTMQADRIARDVIARAGFGDFFGHGLGHGLGREVHELPVMRKTGGEEELRPGMVVTVEPGIYLPGTGGIRIEDDVLITHSGCEVLSSLDKSFEACHVE